MNMDIERIVREKCAELGIEYDDSITKALEMVKLCLKMLLSK